MDGGIGDGVGRTPAEEMETPSVAPEVADIGPAVEVGRETSGFDWTKDSYEVGRALSPVK